MLGNSGMRPCISNGCFKSFWVWYARRVPGMWPWKGFSLSVDENSINASNKKHGKVLTIFHNKDFSPESSNELIAIEDIVLTKTFFLSSCSPTFLPSLFSFPLSVLDWDFLCVVKNLVRVFFALLDHLHYFRSRWTLRSFLGYIVVLYYSIDECHEESQTSLAFIVF